MKIDEIRNEIDELDAKIKMLLDCRFDLTRKIGRQKFTDGCGVEDKDREIKILSGMSACKYAEEIMSVYRNIFAYGKNIQKFDYFLFGKTIENSLSPFIYKQLGLPDYNILPADNTDALGKAAFKGVNITAPFKGVLYEYVHYKDRIAQITRAVNTIVQKRHKLYGYNTDYFGFKNMLARFKINVAGRLVVIIGNGATARTVTAVLREAGAAAVGYLVRTLRGKDEFPLTQYHKFANYHIVINATPYGQTEQEPLFPLYEFTALETVIDLGYNRFLTPLMEAAFARGAAVYNGLYMLVGQAVLSYRLYTGKNKTSKIDGIYAAAKKHLKNIVLIGMPYAGKTTTARLLSITERKIFIDMDIILAEKGFDLKVGREPEFRKKEEELALLLGSRGGQVIATGGGIVYSEKAMEHFRKNGIIVYLDTSLPTLIGRLDRMRPLVNNAGDLENLYYSRRELYKKYADIIVDEHKTAEIGERVYEYFNTERA